MPRTGAAQAEFAGRPAPLLPPVGSFQALQGHSRHPVSYRASGPKNGPCAGLDVVPSDQH